jgi:small subunit ribosomal protein S16
MLAIRLQRIGRKGYAQYRIIVQEAQRSPSSGRVVANLGNFNPHTKEVTVDKEAAEKYLQNGAQPSPRVARLLKSEKVTLPKWVVVEKGAKKRSTKNAEKLRKNQPAEVAEETSATSDDAAEEEKTEDAKPEETTSEAAEEAPAEDDATTDKTEEK